jgi:hypothetical protein
MRMFGGRKTIPECTNKEIRAFLVSGTVIAGTIGVGSFWSRQPGWFLWPLRCFCVVWLATLWRQALRELRTRRRRGATTRNR